MMDAGLPPKATCKQCGAFFDPTEMPSEGHASITYRYCEKCRQRINAGLDPSDVDKGMSRYRKTPTYLRNKPSDPFITFDEAFEDERIECAHCGFIHPDGCA